MWRYIGNAEVQAHRRLPERLHQHPGRQDLGPPQVAVLLDDAVPALGAFVQQIDAQAAGATCRTGGASPARRQRTGPARGSRSVFWYSDTCRLAVRRELDRPDRPRQLEAGHRIERARCRTGCARGECPASPSRNGFGCGPPERQRHARRAAPAASRPAARPSARAATDRRCRPASRRGGARRDRAARTAGRRASRTGSSSPPPGTGSCSSNPSVRVTGRPRRRRAAPPDRSSGGACRSAAPAPRRSWPGRRSRPGGACPGRSRPGSRSRAPRAAPSSTASSRATGMLGLRHPAQACARRRPSGSSAPAARPARRRRTRLIAGSLPRSRGRGRPGPARRPRAPACRPCRTTTTYGRLATSFR